MKRQIKDASGKVIGIMEKVNGMWISVKEEELKNFTSSKKTDIEKFMNDNFPQLFKELKTKYKLTSVEYDKDLGLEVTIDKNFITKKKFDDLKKYKLGSIASNSNISMIFNV